MNLTDAQHMARRLMNTHGLGRIPFEFDRGRRRIGATHMIQTNGVWVVVKITLSSHYTMLLSETEIENVILHEIAHAKAPGDHHGQRWAREARALGIKPERCVAPSASPVGAWQASCANGHKTTKGYHRAPLRVRSCGQCSPGKFDSTKLMTWTKNGRVVNLSEMPDRYRAEYLKISMPSMLTSR